MVIIVEKKSRLVKYFFDEVDIVANEDSINVGDPLIVTICDLNKYNAEVLNVKSVPEDIKPDKYFYNGEDFILNTSWVKK